MPRVKQDITMIRTTLGLVMYQWRNRQQRELKEIYLSIGQGSQIGNIGGFIDSWYWSSTEDEIPEAAYCFSFSFGAVGGNHREGMINVRPIRSF